MVILEKAFFRPVERSKSDYNIITPFLKESSITGKFGKNNSKFLVV